MHFFLDVFARFWLQVWRLQLWGLATQGVWWSFTSWCDQLSICTTACSTLSSAQLFTSLTSTPLVSLASGVFSTSLPLQLKHCPLFLCFAGRILNRFSKDIGLMDSKLPITFVDFYQVRKCWNVPFPQCFNAFPFKHTCVFFSYFCRTSALWRWQLQSSPSCSSPSFRCCYFFCTWGVSTSEYPEMWNVLRLQVISTCFCLMH